jgi:hypothetical protein
MDPSQRPDRELIAKEIDKLDAGRPVTQYDVLAWMQVCTPARAHTHTLSLSPTHTNANAAPRGRENCERQGERVGM